MKTTAQEALKAFEDTWLTTDWSAMTAAQKNSHIANHYALKIAASKEIEANRVEAEAQAVTDNANRKALYISKLQARGFACDNSQADWYKLFNRPEIFGVHWKSRADLEYNKSLTNGGIDYFLLKVVELYYEYVKD